MNIHIVFSANNCPAHTLFTVQYATISTRNNTSRLLAGAHRLPNPNANNRGSIAISFPSWGKNLSGMKEWGSGYISGSRLIALLHYKMGRELGLARRGDYLQQISNNSGATWNMVSWRCVKWARSRAKSKRKEKKTNLHIRHPPRVDAGLPGDPVSSSEITPSSLLWYRVDFPCCDKLSDLRPSEEAIEDRHYSSRHGSRCFPITRSISSCAFCWTFGCKTMAKMNRFMADMVVSPPAISIWNQ